MSQLSQKIEYFKGKQQEILEMDRKLENAKNEYKAELKAVFGVTEGERINILDVVELVNKVSELSK